MKPDDIIRDEQGELWLVYAINEGANKIYLRHMVDGKETIPTLTCPLSSVRRTCTVVEAADETN